MEHGLHGQVTTLVQKRVEEEHNPKQEHAQTLFPSMEGQIVLDHLQAHNPAIRKLAQVNEYNHFIQDAPSPNKIKLSVCIIYKSKVFNI